MLGLKLDSAITGADQIPQTQPHEPAVFGPSPSVMLRMAEPIRGALKVLSGQFAGFAVVGTINTILSFLLYQILYLWVSYWLAYTLVFIASYAFMLLVNAGFVFHTRINPRSAFYYLMVYVLNYIIGLAIITALIEWLRVPAQMAPIGAFAFLVFFNFLGTRFAIGVRI